MQPAKSIESKIDVRRLPILLGFEQLDIVIERRPKYFDWSQTEWKAYMQWGEETLSTEWENDEDMALSALKSEIYRNHHFTHMQHTLPKLRRWNDMVQSTAA